MNGKSIKIRMLEKILGFISKSILWRYNPYVIGITGSVGKTTTKDVIVHILKKHKQIYYTKKNYNNEIGVPLTILGVNKDIKSIFSIFYIFGVWITKMIYCKYPEIVVVEMGVDRPGDMDYLTSIVPLDISVLTAISFAHSEFFSSIDEITREKQKIVTNMKKGGIAIINYDDKNVVSVLNKVDTAITFGKSDGADFVATDIETCFYSCHDRGLSFKLNYKNKIIPVRLKNVIAEHFIYSVLAGIAVAEHLKLNIVEVMNDVYDFQTSPGRMQFFEGIKGSKIIDDTYNASPKSMSAAIDVLNNIEGSRKIAILGDMKELGDISQREHQKIARQLQEIKIDEVFLVGEEMKYAVTILKKSNISVSHFDESVNVCDKIRDVIKSEDTILIKGSRGIHMENVVKELILNKSENVL
ncbi:MAG: UDP-N-acetylmuramoyl-tripeptide--D-alanyl-D-alanine ligase [Candidatus Moraniibacteriota bacterium]|jgi:UDP-N-acetylmuramoyl-tripeptide--D-alanyl-D-alanine ligase